MDADGRIFKEFYELKSLRNSSTCISVFFFFFFLLFLNLVNSHFFFFLRFLYICVHRVYWPIDFAISFFLLYLFMCTKSLQSCLTVCDPMDCSPPGSSVHGILKCAGVGWHFLLHVSSRPRDWAHFSYVSCFGRQVLHH